MTVATFTNANFDIVKEDKDLIIRVKTITINADGGEVATGVQISNLELSDIIGKESGVEIGTKSETTASKLFDIVPVTVVIAPSSTRNEFTLTVDRGSNTTSGGQSARAVLNDIKFSIGANNTSLEEFTLKDNNNQIIGTYTVVGTTITPLFPADVSLSNGTNRFTISPVESAGANNVRYEIDIESIDYSVTHRNAAVAYTTKQNAVTVLSTL